MGTESSTFGGADRLLCLGAPLLPPHSSCNQPKGVIFTAEIETCESSSLFPQEMKVQLGLDESLCRSREGRHPLNTQGPLGDGWGTGALPALRTHTLAWWGRGSKALQRAAGRKEKPGKFLLKRNRKEQRR